MFSLASIISGVLFFIGWFSCFFASIAFVERGINKGMFKFSGHSNKKLQIFGTKLTLLSFTAFIGAYASMVYL